MISLDWNRRASSSALNPWFWADSSSTFSVNCSLAADSRALSSIVAASFDVEESAPLKSWRTSSKTESDVWEEAALILAFSNSSVSLEIRAERVTPRHFCSSSCLITSSFYKYKLSVKVSKVFCEMLFRWPKVLENRFGRQNRNVYLWLQDGNTGRKTCRVLSFSKKIALTAQSWIAHLLNISCLSRQK